MREDLTLRSQHRDGETNGAQESLNPKTLRAALQKEGIENPPHIKVLFNFGRHLNKNDAMSLRPNLGQTDVLLLEGVGWTPETPTIYNGLVTGRVSFKQVGNKLNPFILETLKSIQGRHGIYVHPLDAPRDSQIFRDSDNDRRNSLAWSVTNLISQRPVLSYTQAMTRFASDTETFVKLNRARETFAIQEFHKVVAKALRERRELTTKSELNVMVLYGGAHAVMKELMQSTYSDVETENLKVRETIETQLDDYMSTPTSESFEQNALLEPGFHAYIFQLILGRSAPHIKESKVVAYYVRSAVEKLSIVEWRRFYELCIVERKGADGEKYINEKLHLAGLPPSADAKKIEEFYNLAMQQS